MKGGGIRYWGEKRLGGRERSGIFTGGDGG